MCVCVCVQVGASGSEHARRIIGDERPPPFVPQKALGALATCRVRLRSRRKASDIMVNFRFSGHLDLPSALATFNGALSTFKLYVRSRVYVAAINLCGVLGLMQRRIASYDKGTVLRVCGVTIAVTSYAVLTRRRRRLATGSKWMEDTPVEPAFHKVIRRPPRRSSRSEAGLPCGRIAQIVLTGGPLGGKASLAARLRTELSDRGWRVIVAPSVPAILCNSGCTIPSADDASALLQFEVCSAVV